MVLSLGADETACGVGFLDRSIRMFQSVNLHIGLDHAEGYDSCFSTDVQHFTHTGLSLDFHDASLFNRFDFGFNDRSSSGSSCFRLVLLILLTLLLFTEFFHFAGNLVGFLLLVEVVNLFLESAQLLACQLGAFLFSLRILDGTDGIFNACVRFLKKMFSILLRLFQNRLAVFLQFRYLCLVLGYDVLHLLFTLADVLALGFPITLVSHNVLQILVGIDIFATHNLRSIGNHFFRQTNLAGNLHGKRATWVTNL